MKRRFFVLTLSVFLLGTVKSHAQDPDWVKENTWYFDNFTKDILSWSIFRETFIGVAPEPSGDFDLLFYNLLFKDQLAAKGHCYGMDVMAMLMLKNGGYLGYCHPPYMYSGVAGSPADDTTGPSDATLRTAIQMVHGYQINHGFLSFLLDVMAISKSRDGRHSLQQTEYYLAKNDPPVISITKTVSPADGGHVVIPYFVKSINATSKRIYVYDPNRSYYEPGLDGKEFYTTGINYIDVNPITGSWKFNMGTNGAPVYWSGDPGSGGNCIVIPVSVAGKRDRLPQSLLAEGAYALNTIFIHGDVKIEQLSDVSGKRQFFNDAGNELEPCEEKRLNNILPFTPMDGVPDSKGSVRNTTYFFRGTDPVNIRYKADGAYRIGMIFRGRYIEVKGVGKGNSQQFLPLELLSKGN
ncbi:MAG: hypothetical protein SGI83_15035 [Bacteroidota bacterium]|nr:hypothetical protein [Bacteroidota bacterium]